MLMWLLCMSLVSGRVLAQLSEELFVCPPSEARPDTYWEWMNGNINEAGLTADLEYMKRAGYGAAMIFEAGVGIPRGPVDYNSPRWEKAVVHAMKEAERLGIRLSMHNAPGYSGTGGPWIPVSHSMKQLVWTDTYFVSDGKGKADIVLPRPYAKMGFYRDAYVLAYPSLPFEDVPFRDVVVRVTLDGREIDKDILWDHDLGTFLRLEKGQVLLFELDKAFVAQAATLFRGKREQPLDPHDGPRDYAPQLGLEFSRDGEDFDQAGRFNCVALRGMDTPGTLSFAPVEARYFRITSNRGTNLAELDMHGSPRLEGYAAKANFASVPVSLADNPQQVADEEVVRPGEVVDLTGYMDAGGRLAWDAPKGNWTIVRIGYTTTGETVAAAPDAGVGLDCDKLNKAGLDKHFDLFLTPLLEKLKPWCGTTLDALATDRSAAGKQNWTEGLPEYFKAKRGYDIMPYLLAATGRIVGSVADTERFLWDFRRTHADMFLENYVEHFKARIGRYGLKYVGEAYGDGNFESLEMAARQDYPMSEFWTHYIYGNIATIMLASSAAHVWGKPMIPCECYTGTPFNSKFTEHPYGMKALGDYVMSAGVNRFVYHATTHQPYVGPQPGNLMTMGPFGTHLDRMSTWAGQFAALNLYNARCAYVLQQGLYVADILYLKNEAVSSGVDNYNVVRPAAPYGYRWDIAGAEALRGRLSVKDGRIVLPDGMNYRLMVVAPMERTSPETLERIISLVRQGMTVVLAGNKPAGYLGLDAAKDRQVRGLADELWHEGPMGKGRVFLADRLEPVLGEMQIRPDFSFVAEHKDAQIHFIHRTVGDDEAYFVANHRRRPERLTLSFRVGGKTPWLWNAETGKVEGVVPYEERDGRTLLNLELPECGSMFIVFRRGAGRPGKIEEVVPQSTLVHTPSGTVEYSPAFDFRSTFSMALWAKPETFAAGGRGFLVYPEAGTGNEAQVGISMGQNGVRVYERYAKNQVVLEYDGAIEGWTHVALVYEDGVPALFLNGERKAVGRKSVSRLRPAADVPMAEEQYAASFEGDHTPLEVYSYALTGEQVAALAEKGLPQPRHEGEVWKALDGGWKVRFPAWSKAPSEIELPELQSLHKHLDFDVRHFSGTATYVKDFELSSAELAALAGKAVSLDLGRVENMAEVSVNGSDFVLLWKAPYKTNLAGMLKSGKNRVVVKVTNLYPNRMIGDEHLPEKYAYDEYGRLRCFPSWYVEGKSEKRERVLFSPWKHYRKDDPLLEAGLLGPVCLCVE